MVILRSQNKITEFLVILTWASPFTLLMARVTYHTSHILTTCIWRLEYYIPVPYVLTLCCWIISWLITFWWLMSRIINPSSCGLGNHINLLGARFFCWLDFHIYKLIIAMHAAVPAVGLYIIRHYNRMSQLHESGRSVNGTSHTCLCNVFICFRCTVMGRISTAVGLFVGFRSRASLQNLCKGMHKYNQKLPLSLLVPDPFQLQASKTVCWYFYSY